jgi:hypothetical protein
VRARCGEPAAVIATHRKGDVGILRFIFPQSRYADEESPEEISWEESSRKFDEAKLALLHQEKTADGNPSLFNKLISRDAAEAREHDKARASRHHDRGC